MLDTYTFIALRLPSDMAVWSLPVVSAVSLHLVAWTFCQFNFFLPFLDTLVVFGTSSSSKSTALLSPDESLGETSHTWGLYSELSQPPSEPESLYGSHATGSSSSVILGYQRSKLLQIFQHSPSHSSGSADLAGSEMGDWNGATVEWFEEEVHCSFCSLQRLSSIWAMFLMLFFCFSLVHEPPSLRSLSSPEVSSIWAFDQAHLDEDSSHEDQWLAVENLQWELTFHLHIEMKPCYTGVGGGLVEVENCYWIGLFVQFSKTIIFFCQQTLPLPASRNTRNQPPVFVHYLSNALRC